MVLDQVRVLTRTLSRRESVARAKGLALACTLTEELTNFRVKITLSGHDAYGAGADWREGNRDDLVLALAGWWGERVGRGSQIFVM